MMHDCIVIDPAIQHGKPVLRGTRVPVVRILGGLAGGMTRTDVCQEYDISEDDLLTFGLYQGLQENPSLTPEFLRFS